MNKKIFIVVLVSLFSSSGFAQDDNWGKISGQVFVDYFYNVARDGNFSNFDNTAVEGAKDLNGFLLRRASLNYDKNISDKFSARFRLEADSKANTSNNKIGVFVKDASLKWKNIFEGSDLIFGIQPTPSFDVSERYWGYRCLEKTIQDLRGFVPSRDFGIALRGKISESNNINYTLMFGNNSANSLETDKYKRYYAAVDFSPINNFTIALTGDFKSKAALINPENENETLSNNSILSSLFLGYAEKDKFSFGVEGVFQINQNSSTYIEEGNIKINNVNALGVSAFASYWFSETIGALLRYDYFDPYLNEDPLIISDSRNYIIAGVDFKVDKNISIIPNVIYESYEKDSIVGLSFDPSVTARVTLYYNF
ncbi:MAG: hypothetical protein KBE38_07790 [Ignavibacterium sp.]|nr:hypothetical protein [Ignavibacterium sp.]